MTLSGRQYPMLRIFVEEMGPRQYMSIEEAQAYDQRPFRSMLIRKHVAYRPGKGFCATKEGRTAWKAYQETSIMRLNPTRPLTAYFDATAYGLKVVPKRRAA